MIYREKLRKILGEKIREIMRLTVKFFAPALDIDSSLRLCINDIDIVYSLVAGGRGGGGLVKLFKATSSVSQGQVDG